MEGRNDITKKKMKEHLQPGHFKHIYSFMFLSVSTCMHFGMCIAFSSHSGPFRTPTVHSPPTSTCHQGRARITGCLPGPGSKSSLSILVFQFPSLRLLGLLGHWFQNRFLEASSLGFGEVLVTSAPNLKVGQSNRITLQKADGMLLPSAFL